MTMMVKRGRRNAGNVHRSVPKKKCFGQPRPNDHVNA